MHNKITMALSHNWQRIEPIIRDIISQLNFLIFFLESLKDLCLVLFLARMGFKLPKHLFKKVSLGHQMNGYYQIEFHHPSVILKKGQKRGGFEFGCKSRVFCPQARGIQSFIDMKRIMCMVFFWQLVSFQKAM
jgi:hypothetical protein